MKAVFLKFRLTGGRFAAHTVPVGILNDLEILEEFIIEVARWLYLQKNPAKQKVPRGFSNGFSLHLSCMDDGSALLVLKRAVHQESTLPFEDLFESARDLILKVIEGTAVIGIDFPSYLSPWFDKFGRSLDGVERMEFLNGAGSPVVYSREVRKKRVLDAADEYSVKGVVRGHVFAVNTKNRSFSLRLSEGGEVEGCFPENFMTAITSSLTNHQNPELSVHVKGTILYDGNDLPKRIEEITGIEPVDEPRIFSDTKTPDSDPAAKDEKSGIGLSPANNKKLNMEITGGNSESKIELAVRRAERELALEAGEGMAAVASLVLYNALSDMIMRAESEGGTEEESLACYLQFCRRVHEWFNR